MKRRRKHWIKNSISTQDNERKEINVSVERSWGGCVGTSLTVEKNKWCDWSTTRLERGLRVTDCKEKKEEGHGWFSDEDEVKKIEWMNNISHIQGLVFTSSSWLPLELTQFKWEETGDDEDAHPT